MSDQKLLDALLSLELLGIFVLEHVLRVGHFRPRHLATLHELLAHERAHDHALSEQLIVLGGGFPASPAGLDDAQAELDRHHVSIRFSDVHRERGWLLLLGQVEAVLAGGYYFAIGKLRAPSLQRLAASILASEAQHAAVLSELAYPGDAARAVPVAYVEGRS
ncbi:MAG: ferritin-like domain-containing protein [Solirubrobacteraceae bacterium]